MAAFAYAALFTTLAWRRQDSFEYARFDLGNMAQAVWNTAHGRILETSDSFGETFVRLGAHADPILVALAPLYAVWDDPKLLLAVQAALVAAGAWPAYRIARAELAGLAPAGAAVALAAAYLLYPPLQWATLDEFHPVTLAAPLLLFAIWFLRQRRYVAFALVAAAAALCKEEIGLVVAMLGIYAAVVWRDRRAGLLTTAAGIAWSALALGAVIPHWSPTGEGPFAGRYAAVGGDLPGILGTALTDPLRIAREGLGGRDLGYLAGQLAPLLFLPVLAPVAALVALPELAANLLSSQHAQTSWRFHYVAAQAPFLWWAAVLGVRRLLVLRMEPRPFGRGWGAWTAVPLAGLVAGYLMGPLPWWSHLPGGSDVRAGSYSPDAHDRVAERAVELIPPGASVSASNRMGARLSNRRSVALFPEVGGSEYVVVDRENASYGERNAGGSARARAEVAREQAAALLALHAGGGYATVFEEDGVVVLRRPPARRQATAAR